MLILAIVNSDSKCMVDDEDYAILSRYSWSLDRKGYAKTSAFGTTIKMHRFLLNAPKNKQVDHIDGNPLNNQKENLRLCNNSQNQANRGKPKTKKLETTSIYKGVHLRKDLNKWTARIGFNGTRKHLGHFNTQEEAAKAYNKSALELFGEFAKLNQIEGE